ncbi:hypothetical protein C8Q70DRAFT_428202 [Cubamyces menziesii]|nr:hypothetical protein C8Q70DRAFT_428202 [Cubamyces menziesii]
MVLRNSLAGVTSPCIVRVASAAVCISHLPIHRDKFVVGCWNLRCPLTRLEAIALLQAHTQAVRGLNILLFTLGMLVDVLLPV